MEIQEVLSFSWLESYILLFGPNSQKLQEGARIAAYALTTEALKYSGQATTDFCPILESIGVHLSERLYRLVGFSLRKDALSGFPAELRAKMLCGSIRFATEQFIKDATDFSGILLYFSGQLICIVSLPEEDSFSRLQGLCLKVCNDCLASLHVAIGCVLSKQYAFVHELSRAYVELEEGQSYVRFITNPPTVVIQHEEERQTKTNPKISADKNFFNMALWLSNAIDAGNQKRVIEISVECISRILQSIPRVSAIHISAVFFSQALEATLVSNQIVNREFLQSFMLSRNLLEANNEEEFRREFLSSIQALLSYSQNHKKLSYTKQMEAVMAYLDKNYTDPNISGLMIAETLDIPRSTLYTNFKEYYGKTILSVIHKKRLEYAKRLLTQSNQSVKEIAKETGYISLATLNRAFQKYEGMYPGQFRVKYNHKF